MFNAWWVCVWIDRYRHLRVVCYEGFQKKYIYIYNKLPPAAWWSTQRTWRGRRARAGRCSWSRGRRYLAIPAGGNENVASENKFAQGGDPPDTGGGRLFFSLATFGLLATRRRLRRRGDSWAQRSAFVVRVAWYEGLRHKKWCVGV